MVAELIRETYQDEYGILPEPDPLKGERLPELAKMVGDSFDEWIKSFGKTEEDPKALSSTQPQAQPAVGESSPTIVPEQNRSGVAISQATTESKDLQSTPITGKAGSQNITVNNVNNQQTNSLISSIPSPRSQESSYLRSIDRSTSF
jgi:hypothetical protein